MRGIKVGNFLMYRKSQVCVICNIISDGRTATCIMGVDSKNRVYQGPASDWSSIIGREKELLEFRDSVFNNILHSKQVKIKR